MLQSTFLDVYLGIPLHKQSFKPYPQQYFTIILLTVDLPIDNSEAISQDFPSFENFITLSQIWIYI